MTAGTIHDLLRTRAELSPGSIAIFAPARAPLTYAALCRHLEEVVGELNSQGSAAAIAWRWYCQTVRKC